MIGSPPVTDLMRASFHERPRSVSEATTSARPVEEGEFGRMPVVGSADECLHRRMGGVGSHQLRDDVDEHAFAVAAGAVQEDQGVFGGQSG